jgi:DNA-binding beta-propeller fold protein YncE
MILKNNNCGESVLKIAVGLTMLLVLLAQVAGAKDSYEFVLKIPAAQQWYFNSPSGIAVDSSGNVYVAEQGNSRIQKFSESGGLLSAWGSQGAGDGQFMIPSGIAVDISGNVYVVDQMNNRIQKFNASGGFLSAWGSFGSGDGQFNNPIGVAVDGSGNVYVVDQVNNRIQKFSAVGSFLAKWGISGSGDGQLFYPSGIAVDNSGNVYVADQENNHIQKFSESGSFLAKWGSSGSGDGQFNTPSRVAVDSSGNVYVADTGNHRIQKFNASGGFLSLWEYPEIDGVQFSYLSGIAVDKSGNVYVADQNNNRILKFSGKGVLLSKWEIDSQFNSPYKVAVDSRGNIYVVDQGNNNIQKFNESGVFLSKLGSSGTGDGQFSSPSGVAVDISGNVYVVDQGNYRIQKFSASGGFISTWGSSGFGDGQFLYPSGVAVDNSGNVYVADSSNNRIQKFNGSGGFLSSWGWGRSGAGDGQFSSPSGVAMDNSGNVYVADTGNNRIQKFNLSGVFLSTWGWGSSVSDNDRLLNPTGVAVDYRGNVYVTDTGNNRIQKFNESGGFLSTWDSSGSGDGQFNNPTGIAVDSSGNVYVADTGNNRIQKFEALKGDINDDGSISVADALLYLRYAFGQNTSPYQMSTGDDVTCDGAIHIDDALKVLKKAVWHNVSFSCPQVATLTMNDSGGALSDHADRNNTPEAADNISLVKFEKTDFAKYYSLQSLNITPNASQYVLPLQTYQISNFASFSNKTSIDMDSVKLLEKNGFVVISNPFNKKEEYITRPYSDLKDNDVAIFITSDSLLHIYHIQFDETLRKIEEREFYDLIWNISQDMLKRSLESYNNTDGDLKVASKRNAAYFSTGLSLLQAKPEQVCQSQNDWECSDGFFKKEDMERYSFQVPSFVKDDVERELKLIDQHFGFSESPIFIYKEDYSQYVPRGHYTRSEKLKNYFKAFMWYGRMSMLLKGSDEIPQGTTDPSNKDALISTKDARIQTIGAGLIVSQFNENVMHGWDRIYSVTSFYVGLSDDLGPYEYTDALNSVLGEKFKRTDLDENNTQKLKEILAQYRSTKIYGGTGACVISPPFTMEQANECLENTKGFRLMGQRFIPDSYMFTNLVGEYTDIYQGDKQPFTLVIDGAGRRVRGFPRGLDVMALLGSNRSRELLDKMNDSRYKEYDRQYDNLKNEFDSFNNSEWNKNLYWSWLFALKPLMEDHGKGYPTFMQTTAWKDKELTTSLASWTELRHDTILYAKQSYSMAAGSAYNPPKEKPAAGYVEPVPEFYNRLLALTRMTNKGLGEMNVLDESEKSRLESLENILARLVEISSKELENSELTQDEYDFIKNIGDSLYFVTGDVEDKARKTTIIADVHTQGKTRQVLEEGTGYVDLIVVAYKLPDGRIQVGAGPVMSYYEFKQPMDNRLTDEAWRELLEANPPAKPEWIFNYLERDR